MAKAVQDAPVCAQCSAAVHKAMPCTKRWPDGRCCTLRHRHAACPGSSDADMWAQQRCGQRTLAALQPLQEVGFIQLLQDWLRILMLQDGLQLPASPCLQANPPMASESAYDNMRFVALYKTGAVRGCNHVRRSAASPPPDRQ